MMTNLRHEWKKFFIWLRNGFCFLTTWFMLLLWILCRLNGSSLLFADMIPAVMLGSAGAVLIFCSVFTKVFLRKTGFTVRFTLFFALIVLYELAYGYAAYTWLSGLEIPPMQFGGWHSGEWVLFAVIVLVMYAVSMGIYAVYRRKKGEIYTQALQNYQNRKTA